ncbi:MAG: DUF4270 family protein [Rikenellaceae bacterium]
MIKYFKNSKSLIFLLSISMLSCTTVDDNLGSELVPPNDKMKIVTDVVDNGFEIRSVKVDSLLSDISESYYLGSSVFPYMGRLDASFVAQISSGDLPEGGVFPKDLVVDSAFMILGQNGYSGLENYDLTLSVYELNKKLPYPKDSSYYTNFPIKDYIPAAPYLVTTVTSSKSIYMRLDPASVVKYMKTTKEQNEKLDLFHDAFFGYYFHTTSTFGEGVLFNINPSSSGIKIYYRDSQSSTKVKTYTLSFAHLIDNQATGNKDIIGEGFGFFERDYSYIDPSLEFDPTSTEKTYVMGNVGLITEITIPSEFIEKIHNTMDDDIGSVVGVLRAELTVPIANHSIVAMNNSIPNLALYYDYQSFNFMPGYNMSNQSDIGGALNRAKGEYSFNITAYLQDLITNKSKDFTLQIAPTVYNMFTFQGTELANTAKRPIRLTITYTTNK